MSLQCVNTYAKAPIKAVSAAIAGVAGTKPQRSFLLTTQNKSVLVELGTTIAFWLLCYVLHSNRGKENTAHRGDLLNVCGGPIFKKFQVHWRWAMQSTLQHPLPFAVFEGLWLANWVQLWDNSVSVRVKSVSMWSLINKLQPIFTLTKQRRSICLCLRILQLGKTRWESSHNMFTQFKMRKSWVSLNWSEYSFVSESGAQHWLEVSLKRQCCIRGCNQT